MIFRTARQAPPPRTSFPVPWRIFWVGLIVRLLYMTLAHTYHVRPAQDHFAFGWESGRIARALVTGFGYADPFTGHTGPTAWLPPLYPLLLAAIFKLFGVYTPVSAWVALAINCLASAAIIPAVYAIALRLFWTSPKAESIAVWSGWIWALYPAAMQYGVRWLWEMSITACLFTWSLVLAFSIRDAQREKGAQAGVTAAWAAFGLTWGLIALSNSTLLLFFPVCVLWMLGAPDQTRFAFRKQLVQASVACLLLIACLAPWIGRNWLVFHAVIPMRSNFGAELYSSLLEDHNGFELGTTIPLAPHDPKLLRYKALSEHAFVHDQMLRSEHYLASHKERFAKLAAIRFYFFWVSTPHVDTPPFQEWVRVESYCFASLAGLMGLALALWNRVEGAGLLAWSFVLLPLPYYLVNASARFRHPLEPLIVIFGVYLFQSATKRSAGHAGVSRNPASEIG